MEQTSMGAPSGFDGYQSPLAPSPPPAKGGGLAIASLVLGIVGLVAWFCPLLGLPITVTGLILGIKGRASDKATMAKVGIALCLIGLAAALINAAWGAYLGATGQHPLFQR